MHLSSIVVLDIQTLLRIVALVVACIAAHRLARDSASHCNRALKLVYLLTPQEKKGVALKGFLNPRIYASLGCGALSANCPAGSPHYLWGYFFGLLGCDILDSPKAPSLC